MTVPFLAEVDRLRAELMRARATVQRAASELQRAERLRAENAMSLEEHDRRAAFAQEATAQVAAVEAALRAVELNLEFTRVVSPIAGRVSRAIVTEGNLVSSGPGEATLMTTVVSLDPIHAHFDADERIFLRYIGAGAQRRQARMHRQPACRSAWRSPTRRVSRARAGSTSSTTGSIRRAGRSAAAPSFANPDGALTPGSVRSASRRRERHVDRALLVQDRAVGTDLDKKFVLVVGPEQTRFSTAP